MATIKLADTWILESYANVFESCRVEEYKSSGPLSALKHWAFPGVSWRIDFYPRGVAKAKPNYSSIFVFATFGPESEKHGVSHVWAAWTITVIGRHAKDNQSAKADRHLYFSGNLGWDRRGFTSACLQDDVKAAVRTEGHLEIRFELTLFKTVDLLKCRDTVRALFSGKLFTDLAVDVECKIYEAHKAILAKRCVRFNEAVPDTTMPEDYAAFLGAIYFDNFDFLSKWDLALGVLRLASSFGASKLKEICDDALSELIPTVSFATLLQILPDVIHCGASASKAVCVRCLAEKKDVLSLPEWSNFKDLVDKNIMSAICDAFLESRMTEQILRFCNVKNCDREALKRLEDKESEEV